MADYPLNGGRPAAQFALHLINLLVDALHRQRRIDPAVKIDDLTVVGFAYPHVVDVANAKTLRGNFG